MYDFFSIMKKHKKELKGKFPSVYWLTNNHYFHLTNAIKRHHVNYTSVKEKLGFKDTSKETLSSLLEQYAGGQE